MQENSPRADSGSIDAAALAGVTSDHTNREAAHAYARAGVPVFAANGKSTYAGTHGHKDATTDPVEIDRMFDRYPNATVAGVPGEGYCVVDVDKGSGGGSTLAHLTRTYEPIHTLSAKTGSGGAHLWFRMDPENPIPQGAKFLPGLDTRVGTRGYVILPPSIHPVTGKRYEWIQNGRGIADLPDWLRREIVTAKRSSVAAPDIEPGGPSRGNRQQVLYNFGKDTRKGGASPDTVRIAMQTENAGWDDPLEDWEVEKTIKNVLKNVHPTPGTDGINIDAPQDDFDAVPGGAVVKPADPVEEAFQKVRKAKPGPALTDTIRAALDAIASISDPVDRDAMRAVLTSQVSAALRAPHGTAEVIISKARPQARAHNPYTRTADDRLIIRAEDLGAPDEGQDWLVREYIPAAAVGEVFADSGMLKSWLMLDAALSVAFGKPGILPGPLLRGAAIYLAYEGQHALRKRIAGWLKAHEIIPESFRWEDVARALDGRFILAAAPPSFDAAGVEEALMNTVEDAGVRLIVVDTRTKSLGAEQSEDRADTANAVNGMLSRITARTGATAISTHHVGLQDKNRNRGSSAWIQGVDFSFTVKGNPDLASVGMPVTLACKKMRDDERPRDVYFRLRKLALEGDGQAFNSAVLEAVEDDSAEPSLEALVFEYVQQNPKCGKGDVRESVRQSVSKGNTAIDEALGALVRRGAILDEQEAERRPHYYTAAPGWRVNGSQVECPDFSDPPASLPGDDATGEVA